MKNYYKISEISKLYGIGPDSLRYYERLGILKPKRDTNQYRLYSLKDLYKLNLICDLRKLKNIWTAKRSAIHWIFFIANRNF